MKQTFQTLHLLFIFWGVSCVSPHKIPSGILKFVIAKNFTRLSKYRFTTVYPRGSQDLQLAGKSVIMDRSFWPSAAVGVGVGVEDEGAWVECWVYSTVLFTIALMSATQRINARLVELGQCKPKAHHQNKETIVATCRIARKSLKMKSTS